MALLAGGAPAQLAKDKGTAGAVQGELAFGSPISGARLSAALPFSALFQAGDGEAQLAQVASVISGALDGTESGADSMASDGSIPVSGSLSATESGQDSFSASGAIIVSGALDVAESGADTFDATGTVSSAIFGDMAAVEAGNDAASASGVVTYGTPAYLIWQYEITPGLQAQTALLDAYTKARALYEKYIGPA